MSLLPSPPLFNPYLLCGTFIFWFAININGIDTCSGSTQDHNKDLEQHVSATNRGWVVGGVDCGGGGVVTGVLTSCQRMHLHVITVYQSADGTRKCLTI